MQGRLDLRTLQLSPSARCTSLHKNAECDATVQHIDRALGREPLPARLCVKAVLSLTMAAHVLSPLYRLDAAPARAQQLSCYANGFQDIWMDHVFPAFSFLYLSDALFAEHVLVMQLARYLQPIAYT